MLYYAALEPVEYRTVRCPIQLHFAEHDNWDPADTPTQFGAALRRDGVPSESFDYPVTQHSFANADVERYEAVAASAAW